MAVKGFLSKTNSKPVSISSRPSSITRSSRDNFIAEMELLPPEHDDHFVDLRIKDMNVVDEYYLEVDSKQLEVGGPELHGPKVHGPELNGPEFEVEDETVAYLEVAEIQEEIDPKIKKGLKRIEKLDKILYEKTEKEKEIKQERRSLERQFHRQVKELIDEKGINNICGSQQLLSLCIGLDQCNERDDTEDNYSIFTTQINTEFTKCRSENKNSKVFEEENEDVLKTTTKHSTKHNKDYIKRNIQLASQAQDIIPLTEEERRRLDELLADDADLLLVENPFSTPVIDTSGYKFSIKQQKALEDIDAKLKELVPEEDFELVALETIKSNFKLPLIDDNASTVSESVSVNSYGNYSIGKGSSVEDDSASLIGLLDETSVECGEKVLQTERDHRNLLLRLNDIETRLHNLHMSSQNENTETIKLDPDLLRKLLDVDSRLTSSSRSICESVTSTSLDVDLTSVGSQSVAEFEIEK